MIQLFASITCRIEAAVVELGEVSSIRSVVSIPMKRLDTNDPPLEGPRRIRAGDAAADLPSRHDVVIAAGARELVPTGFAIALPPGFCGLILPRSGLALRSGISVLNSPGLIDSGYRGELQVILFNSSAEDVSIERGQRIAQLLVQSVPNFELTEVDELPAAIDDRGSQGFGSSG